MGKLFHWIHRWEYFVHNGSDSQTILRQCRTCSQSAYWMAITQAWSAPFYDLRERLARAAEEEKSHAA